MDCFELQNSQFFFVVVQTTLLGLQKLEHQKYFEVIVEEFEFISFLKN